MRPCAERDTNEEIIMSWMHTKNLYAWIFNTGRGLSVCLRFPNNWGLVYDLGSSDEFSPTGFVRTNIAPYLKGYRHPGDSGVYKIAQCVMSHPHADHIGEVEQITKHPRLTRPLAPSLITCPNEICSADKLNFSRIENKDNYDLIQKYKKSYAGRRPPLQTIVHQGGDTDVPDFEYGLYYMRPPAVDEIHENNDHHYGNGVSIAMYMRYGKLSLLLPGDVTPEVLPHILDDTATIVKRYSLFYRNGHGDTADWHTAQSNQPGLGSLLGVHGLSVLLAPHHGLESCYCKELFDAIRGGKPVINLISDKRKKSETDGNVHPRYHREDGAFGLNVDIDGASEFRYGVSTKNGHHMLVVLRAGESKPAIYLRSAPEDLLMIE